MTAPHPSPADRKRRTSALKLSAIGVVVSVAWYISFVFGAGTHEGARVTLSLVGGVVAPTLATIAAVGLSAPTLGLSRARALVVLVLAALAFAGLALVGLSFSVGIDEADAGRQLGLLASLTTAFALTAVLASASAITLVLFSVLRKHAIGVRKAAAIAVVVGIVATPLVLLTLLGPGAIVMVCAAVFVLALVPTISRVAGAAARATAAHAAAARDDSANDDTASTAIDRAAVRDRVTLFAGTALATSLIVWVGGIGVSIHGTGTDLAGTGLGVAAAIGQLAVVPLLWAATLAIGALVPRVADSARIGFAVASAVVVAAVAVMVVGFSPAGDLYIVSVGALSVGVALWGGAVVWAITPPWPTPARAGAAVVAVVAGAALYAMLVALSGGVTLALVSGFVAFGGARLLLRPSPATLPAS